MIDTFGAVRKLPTYDQPAQQMAVRTGTDDTPTWRDQIRDQLHRSNTHSGALSCNLTDSEGKAARSHKPAKNADSDSAHGVFVPLSGIAAERIRTSTGICPLDPKSSASADSATAAVSPLLPRRAFLCCLCGVGIIADASPCAKTLRCRFSRPPGAPTSLPDILRKDDLQG